MPYLEAAVQSVLSQTFSNFEFLVIDDHSQDGTRSYLNSINDSRLRVLDSVGQGLTESLNFGLSQTKSPWIARMDSDDWSYPSRLARQMEAAQKPGTVLISANYLTCDQELNPVGEIRLSPPNPKLFSYLEKKNNPFCHPVMMFNRDAALKVGGYRFERAQDYDLWIRLLRNGSLAHVDETLLKYRVRRLAISIKNVDEQSKSRMTIQKGLEGGMVPSTAENHSAQYEYRLGFSAWLAGNRWQAAVNFIRAVVHGTHVFRCLMAMALMIFPRRAYLKFAGYEGVYQ